MRYGEQIFEIDVPLDDLDWECGRRWSMQIEDRFHRRHEELYTYASRGQEVVFVNARVAAVGEVSQRGEDAKTATQASACSPQGTRQAFFGGWREIPGLFASTSCSPATRSTGPAIIEAETTTVLIGHRRPRQPSMRWAGWMSVLAP